MTILVSWEEANTGIEKRSMERSNYGPYLFSTVLMKVQLKIDRCFCCIKCLFKNLYFITVPDEGLRLKFVRSYLLSFLLSFLISSNISN